MREYIEIGSTPCEEECQQVGSEDYNPIIARKECKIFANQLERTFANPQPSNTIAVKGFHHDFGTYHEVVVYYDTADEKAVEYAFNIEANAPECWDEIAKKEIADAIKQFSIS